MSWPPLSELPGFAPVVVNKYKKAMFSKVTNKYHKMSLDAS